MEQITAKHNPLTFYLRTLLYMFIALLLRILTFAPLACLFAFPSGSALRYLALLCPLLLIFFLLPLRFSFAEALVQKPHQRWFLFDLALSTSNYAEKLTESLLHALNVLKWGIPLFAMLGYCYYCYLEVGISTLLASLGAIGKGVTDFTSSIANFFITLFGSIKTIPSHGGLVEGIIVIAAVLGVGVLIWLYGALRNSTTRYIWVTATRAEKLPHKEIRRRMRGHRFAQFLHGLVNLVLWMPFCVTVISVLKTAMSDVSSVLMFALAQQKLPTMDLTTALLPLVFCFTFLYLPLLPVRRCLTAFFATRTLKCPAAVDMSSVEPMQTNETADSTSSAFSNVTSVTAAPVPPFVAAEQIESYSAPATGRQSADPFAITPDTVIQASAYVTPAYESASNEPATATPSYAQVTDALDEPIEYDKLIEEIADADEISTQPNFTVGQ